VHADEDGQQRQKGEGEALHDPAYRMLVSVRIISSEVSMTLEFIS
jgi:hypothetical protein